MKRSSLLASGFPVVTVWNVCCLEEAVQTFVFGGNTMAKVAVSCCAFLFAIAVLGPASAQDVDYEATISSPPESVSVEDLIEEALILDESESDLGETSEVYSSTQQVEVISEIDLDSDESITLANYSEAQEEVPVPPNTSEFVTPTDGPVFLHEDGSQIAGNFMGICNTWCRAGLVGGVEGTFLAPISEPQQAVYLTDLTNGLQYVGHSRPGFGSGVRTWIGLQNNGWGFRVRYWHFGNDFIDPNPVVPVNAEPAFISSYYLRADVLDIELTQAFCFLGCELNTSFGARYAELERQSSVVGYGDVGNGVNLYGLAMGANEIAGTGFTTSIGGRKPLHFFWCHSCDSCGGPCAGTCCNPCGRWLGFWNVRGSVLWADSTVSALTDANAVIKGSVVAAANSRNKASATKDHSETLGILELQLGIEYQRCLRCCPATAFVRAGAEYQYWDTGDLAAFSNSFASLEGSPPPFGGRADAVANAHDGDLGLIGFILGAGLTY